ncbi:hypothetical protein [Streptomyces rochei]
MTTATRPTKPRINYPQPPLVRDHRELFREPTYQDGQPYNDGALEDDDDD